ncbi:MAG: hypothetical protein D6698_09435 [Gammaproteobacteria bacterium]|nr:MAG: hypothetical protein D6698_09435 [Gammaproteobacteria bacterium]
MFGIEANPEIAFEVYHDESGTYVPGAGDRWLLHGVLFVPVVERPQVFTALQGIRKDTGYFEEVHYLKLRQSTGGPKAQCARGWLNLYVAQLSEFCYYHCLAVDTHSPTFEHNRFPKPHYAYNRFARMAIEGAIAWNLKRYHRVALIFYSDSKFRQEGDNFATYVPSQVMKSIQEKRQQKPSAYPDLRLLHPEVIAVDSDPAKVAPDLREESELIQLVDLMTSNITQAVTGRSGQKAKIALAEVAARWIEDTRKPPWLQTEELHRRFSVSFFPNEQKRFYNPELAVTKRNQLPLFENEEK